jgi:hypothetical protein
MTSHVEGGDEKTGSVWNTVSAVLAQILHEAQPGMPVPSCFLHKIGPCRKVGSDFVFKSRA